MRTLLNSIKETDDYLIGLLSGPDALVFEARTLIDVQLQAEVIAHIQTHKLIHQFGQAQLRADIEAVHKKLFTQPQYITFTQRILRFFKG